jgi:hypothetical protein
VRRGAGDSLWSTCTKRCSRWWVVVPAPRRKVASASHSPARHHTSSWRWGGRREAEAHPSTGEPPRPLHGLVDASVSGVSDSPVIGAASVISPTDNKASGAIDALAAPRRERCGPHPTETRVECSGVQDEPIVGPTSHHTLRTSSAERCEDVSVSLSGAASVIGREALIELSHAVGSISRPHGPVTSDPHSGERGSACAASRW